MRDLLWNREALAEEAQCELHPSFENFVIWNLDFTKTIEFDKIGVLRLASPPLILVTDAFPTKTNSTYPNPTSPITNSPWGGTTRAIWVFPGRVRPDWGEWELPKRYLRRKILRQEF